MRLFGINIDIAFSTEDDMETTLYFEREDEQNGIDVALYAWEDDDGKEFIGTILPPKVKWWQRT